MPVLGVLMRTKNSFYSFVQSIIQNVLIYTLRSNVYRARTAYIFFEGPDRNLSQAL